MKISKLYTNQPDLFEPVNFFSGLNVALAEIRLPENKKKDTHNLGKTTLGQILDFCLLSEKKKEFFLFKHFQLFKDFVFYLEIELLNGKYITIRRSVKSATKIWFKKHQNSNQDFTSLLVQDWDHSEIPFKRAKVLLDGLLDLESIKPWSFRKGLGYLLRTQSDYLDVFQLNRYKAAHSDWKPYLAKILGFDASLIEKQYEKVTELESKERDAGLLEVELGGSIEDISKIEGLLLLKQKEQEKKQTLIDSFNFQLQDKDKIKQLVDELDVRIATINNESYSLNHNLRKIRISLEEKQILFSPDEAKKLFKEVGIQFDGQIKKDFEQLIAFNRSITEERRFFLEEEKAEIEVRIKNINAELNTLNDKRSDTLAFLGDTDVFEKYKEASQELVSLKADLLLLKRQRNFLRGLQDLRKEIRTLEDEKDELQKLVEEDVERQNSESDSLFTSIRLYFNEIVEAVINRKALLSVSPNKLGNLEFRAEILDQAGNATSADMGQTYRKLLCIAFDMAILRAHLDVKFPRFVFHDGIFESLDDRKKENLLEVIRKYSEFGIQQIITLIDSDLPARDKQSSVFEDNEIVLLLHDEGEKGRLFKMQAW